MSSSYTDVFGGALLPPVYNSFASFTFTTPVTPLTTFPLNWSTQFQNGGNVVASIMNFTAQVGGLSVTLPDATQTSVGQQFLINNIGSNTFALNGNDNTLIANITNGSASIFYLADNSTIKGTWFHIPAGGGGSAVTSISAVPAAGNSAANLGISPTTITTTGTFTFNFLGDLASLINFSTNTGFGVRTAANTWTLRTLTGQSNQIELDNANGVLGNPVIKLASDIQDVTSISVGNLLLAGNTISAFAGNDIFLEPSGSGQIIFSGNVKIQDPFELRFYDGKDIPNYLSITAPGGYSGVSNIVLELPTLAPANGQVLGFVSGTSLGWFTVAGSTGPSTLNAVPRFIDTSGTLGSTGILVDNSNNMSGVNSIVAQNLLISAADGNTISSSVGNINLTPTGTNAVYCNKNLAIRTGSSLNIFNAANTGYAGFNATTTTIGATNSWSLPTGEGAANSLMYTNGSFQMGFSNLTLGILPQAIAQFTGTSTPGAATLGYSVGITSIVKTGVTGAYTITFSSAFSNTAYWYQVCGNSGNNAVTLTSVNSSTTVSTITLASGGSANDMNGLLINILVFGQRPTY